MSTAAQGPCVVLPWDTEFFGFRIARVCRDVLTLELVQEIDAWCHQNRVKCLYFLAKADEPGTTWFAEDGGFRLVDVRLTLACATAGSVARSTGHGHGRAVIRSSREWHVSALKRIAGQAHRGTRFFYDVNFPRDRATQLYEKWIERSCEGYADAVLVAELNCVPVGYISCHLDERPRIGRIGLVGVSGEAQGRGIGRELVLSALGWFCARGAERVLVVTQGRNVTAQRLYQQCGFVTQAVQLWYHKWYHLSEEILD